MIFQFLYSILLKAHSLFTISQVDKNRDDVLKGEKLFLKIDFDRKCFTRK